MGHVLAFVLGLAFGVAATLGALFVGAWVAIRHLAKGF